MSLLPPLLSLVELQTRGHPIVSGVQTPSQCPDILKIDTLRLEGFYPQKVARFSQLVFGPHNMPQVAHKVVSFGLNAFSRRGKDGQTSMIEGLLHSPQRCKIDAYWLALPPQRGCNYRVTC